jgi:hypothetical protein
MDEINATPVPVAGTTFAVFRHRPFLLFFIGTFISNIGNWAWFKSRRFWVTECSRSP